MIPLALTTITVSRVPVDPTRDGYDTAPAAVVVASGVRAVIGSANATEQIATGVRVAYTFTLTCDPTDLQPEDTVTDDTTGDVFTVDWARLRPGLGIDHMQGVLRIVTGAQ